MSCHTEFQLHVNYGQVTTS